MRLLAFAFCFAAVTAARAEAGTDLSSLRCREFQDFAIRSGQLLTEGLVVIRDGATVFEFYDDPYGPDRPHALWSLTKTITGELLGTAIRDGRVSLSSKLSEFLPGANPDPGFAKIDIANLFYLDAGFVWDEYYAGNIDQSPVISMLYGRGHADMAAYAASRAMISQGPGYEWNYTSGTPVLTMAVLKKIYGPNYARMPWTQLFDPLGMKNVSFERDSAGTFVGGSLAYATPRDLAKIGSLLLARGRWNGTTLLPEDWVAKTLSVSPGYLSDGTVVHDITDDGVYGGSIWLNRAVKTRFGRPYPYSPEDMFLGMGHYGQLLIVLPTQKMVIARTGHDREYNSKIDEFVSRAISCFADPTYPIGKIIPPPPSATPSVWKELETLSSGITHGVIQAAVAKSICSCHFISRLDVATCLERSNIPLAKTLTTLTVDDHSVRVRLSWPIKLLTLHFSDAVEADFDLTDPQFGCTLH